MKRFNFFQITIMILAITISLSSCEVVGGIFKAGMWVGVLAVVGIIALVLYFVGKAKK